MAGLATGSHLSVTGDAEIQVVPDRVVLFLGVETRDASLTAARATHDRLMRSVLAAARDRGLAPGDMQTDFVHIEPRHHSDRSTEVAYYVVRKSLVLTLRDISRFESLLAAALDAGANHVHGIDFQTSQLARHREKARELAVQAAMRKAQEMARAAGVTLGEKPTGISSYQYGGRSWYGSGWSGPRWGGQFQNVRVQVGTAESPEGTTALGRISVTASVTLSFATR